jgi:hypothetical protein
MGSHAHSIQEIGGRVGRSTHVIVATLLLAPGIVSLVSAHCPLCTAGAVLGVGIARAYGVDDSIVGLFLGAFVSASALWVDNLLKKRDIRYPFQTVLLVIGSLLLVAVPLYAAGIITHVEVVRAIPAYPSIFGAGTLGIDRLFFGLLFGTIVVAGVFTLNDYLNRKRGRRLFAYQGLVFMAITLIVFSLIFWMVTR